MVPGPAQAAGVVALDDDDHVEVQRRRYRHRLESDGRDPGRCGRAHDVALPARRVLPLVPRRRRLGVRRAAGRARAARSSARASSTAPAPPTTCASPWYNLTNGSSWSPSGWGCDGARPIERAGLRCSAPARCVLGVDRRRSLLWWFAGQRYDDAVADLAPAPIGCDTTLVFDRAGTYTFFLETTGTVGEIDGDCDTDDRSYDLGDDDPPALDVTLLDDRRRRGRPRPSRRTELRPRRRHRAVASARPRSTRPATTCSRRTPTLATTPRSMIRVGRDPSSGVTAMRVGARRRAAGRPGASACCSGARPAADRADRPGGGRATEQWPQFAPPTATDRARRTPTRRSRRPTACHRHARPRRRRPGRPAASPAGAARCRRRHHHPEALSAPVAQRRRMTVTTRP